MRMTRCALVLLAIANTALLAQQGAILSQPYHQTPDSDGVYFVGPEVSLPTLSHAVAAVYSNEMLKSTKGGMSIWSAIIRGDGTLTDAHLLQPLGAAFDAAAIDAIKRSSFEPGKLNGKPIAVSVGVAVPFRYGKYPSTPVIGSFERDIDPNDQRRNIANTDPVVIHSASWSFSASAIQAKYQGASQVSVLVGEDGMPSQASIIRPVGMGLDEKAIEAVRRFRFRPAMRDGRPVPARTNVEVKFLIY